MRFISRLWFLLLIWLLCALLPASAAPPPFDPGPRADNFAFSLDGSRLAWTTPLGSEWDSLQVGQLADTRPLPLATGTERSVAVHGFRPEDWAQAPRREPVQASPIYLMSLNTGRLRDQVMVLPTRVAPGVSGSAVLDGDDRLTGIIIRGQADILSGQTQSDTGLMRPLPAIREFLAKAAITPVTTGQVRGDLADSAVQVICVRPDGANPLP